MVKNLILFSSITYANRAGEFLYKRGFHGRVIKTPAAYTNKSCGYSLAIKAGESAQAAAEELGRVGMRYIKVVPNDE